jgi:hypothetical protein
MKFHRIGNSVYSDDQLRNKSEEIVSLPITSLVALASRVNEKTP